MTQNVSTLAFISMPGWPEVLIIAFIGLLLFGKRLPEVGKSLGKGIVEFKKGLRGIEDEIDDSVNRSSTDRVLPRTAPHETAEVTSSEPEKSEVNSGK